MPLSADILYYDIHTHNLQREEGSLQIVNAYNGFSHVVAEGGYCSIGLHPWYLSNYETDLAEITELASQDNVLAIGECGLDKICKTDWQLQVTALRSQIRLADTIRKPLIIHCVRACNELLEIFREMQPKVPAIIHGFNKKGTIAQTLLDNGFYLSFGAAMLNDRAPINDVVKGIGAEHFFLETDTADIRIAGIYKKAAEIRQTSEEEIILQQRKNFKTVFSL